MLSLKQLKTILQSKLFYLLILLLSILYTVYYINNDTITVKNDKTITGKITNIKEYENKVTCEINGKDKVIVNYYGNDFNYNLGDTIKLSGEYKLIDNNTVFNLFNYKKYLLSKGIKYSFTANEIKKISSNTNILYFLKNKIKNYLNTFKSRNYLNAFLLGENNIDDLYKKSFQSNGISHLFAISGMHITVFTLIINKLLSLLIKNKKTIYLSIYIFLLIYMFLTGFTPSVIRGSLLYILNSLKKVLKINIKTIYILILIFSICLLVNPYVVYNIGFKFSFIISFYLIIFNKIINQYNNYFVKTFVISLIAFLVSMPICINNFFEINLLSPFVNILFVPFISIIIFPLSIITIIFKPLDNILFFLTNLIGDFSLLISKINCFIIPLCHINTIGVIIYYLILTYILLGFYKRKYYRIVYIFVILIIHYNISYLDNNLYMTMIDVGQGDSILIKFPNNNGNVLLDTGGNWLKKDAINKLISYFKSSGIKNIDYLIISHGDYDHMGEAINLVNNIKIEKVIFNCGEYNNLEKELIKVLDKKKIKYYSCIKELNIDKNKLYFLQTKEFDNENDNSNVIYTELNGYKFLFMGDASINTEKEILDKYNLPDIDVLKVGHHGSKTSSSKAFIDEINPKYSIISVGKNNRYGHPNKEVLDNLNNSKVYRTDKDGSIMFKMKNNKLEIETCSP